MGGNYEQKSKFTEAINCYLNGLDISHELELDQEIFSGYKYLAINYLNKGQIIKALEYINRSYWMERHIFNEERLKTVDEIEVRYETEKTKRELADQTLLKQQADFHRNIFSTLFFIAIVLSFLGYLYFKQKQQASITIAQQQEKIHQQEIQELLKTQELTAINSLLEGQENERLRIAKDLHDRLGSMLTTVKWSFDGFLEDTPKVQHKAPLEKASAMLDEAYQEVRRIAHDMVSGVLTKFGLVPALQELGRTISDGNKMHVKILANGLDDRIENKLEITIYRIIQELLSNVLKHAKASETIVQLTRTSEGLNISVEDNGLGFDLKKINFGMGIKNIEARVQALNGSLFIDSGKGNGTTVMIDLPIL